MVLLIVIKALTSPGRKYFQFIPRHIFKLIQSYDLRTLLYFLDDRDNFHGDNFCRDNFHGTTFTGTTFTGATFTGTTFIGTTFIGTTFIGTAFLLMCYLNHDPCVT